jgi:dolichol kinase
MAAAVPTLFLLLLITTTLGYTKNERFVRTLSSEEESLGLLKGPLLYVLFMIFMALYLWYVPLDIMGTPQFDMLIPTAFLILGPLAGGNSLANLIGRRYGRHKFNVVTEKSVEGSLIMFLFSLLFTFVLLGIYWLILGRIFESFSIFTLLIPIFVVSSVTTIVEAMSPRHTDYVLIPLSALITIIFLSWIGLYPYFVMFPLRNPFLP